jgi:hypothetical protein
MGRIDDDFVAPFLLCICRSSLILGMQNDQETHSTDSVVVNLELLFGQ